MSKVTTVWNLLCKYKYGVVVLLAALFIGLLDENSVLNRSRRQARIAELRREIADYEARFDAASSMLRSLDNEPGKLEQVAREKYYMKRAGEDIYVIKATSEDEPGDADTQEQDSVAQ